MNRPLLSLVFTVASATCCLADQGDPIAIIRLPGGGVAVETMWNHSVVIADSAEDRTSDLAGVDLIRGNPQLERTVGGGRFVVDASNSIDHVFDRPANQAKATWKPSSQAADLSPHAIHIRTIATAILIEVDGARIVHIASPSLPQFTPQQAQLIGRCDACIINGQADENAKAKAIAEEMAARRLIVQATSRSDDFPVVAGNTIAISANNKPNELQVQVLDSKPIELSEEWTTLIRRKEAACQASQKVFQKLSIGQLNFRPGNGSHTPRWNAEHMMGRELLFFSQIFHAQDDSIPIMNLNPKQMPPDYLAKHPDWTGVEEALQMQRVSAFTRRFAYFMKDLPLDRKAPGSGWTPRKLLLQMERHYNDHTANVKKKFALPDWPTS